MLTDWIEIYSQKFREAFSNLKNPEFLEALEIVIWHFKKKCIREFMKLRLGKSSYPDLGFVRLIADDLIFSLKIKLVGLVK